MSSRKPISTRAEWVSHLWLTEYLPPEESSEGETRRQGDKETEETSSSEKADDVTAPGEESSGGAEAEDDPTRQLTFSGDGETHPRWSPDGRYLTFLSSRVDETEAAPDDDDDAPTDQVWILPIDGGEARKVTSAKEGVLDYEWVLDTNSIAYLASEPRPRPLETLRKDERHRRKIDPIVEQDDRLRRQVWRVDVDDRKPILVFTGDYGVMEFAVSPDGTRLAFITNYSGEGNDYHLADLYVRYLETGETVKLVARGGGKYHLRWSPDGKQLAFLSWLDPELSYSRECAFGVEVPQERAGDVPLEYGKDAPGITDCRLLTELDYDIGAFEWAYPPDTPEDNETVEEPIAAQDGVTALGYALAAARTGSDIFALMPDGTETSRVAGQDMTSPSTTPVFLPERYDLSRDPSGNGLVYVQESTTALPEIFFCDTRGEAHQLTKLNADFAETYRLPRQEVVSWTSADGLTIEGVLTYPIVEKNEGGRMKDEKSSAALSFILPPSSFPLVVQIHGGPKGRATDTLLNYHMAAVWASEGYVVLRPNFRGSEGYGNAFAVANRRDLGGGDYHDIMTGVDWCVAQGIADPERLGVMGGSYGGYMTNWVIGHTQRFKAAISMFGIFHLQTDYSNSELSRWDNDYLGAYYWEDPEIYRRLSPGSYIEAIKTPTLIIHGDEDTNTFISNSKELYQALRHRGVTTQFVHYPREGHGVREPNHKLDEIRRCLAWMDKYVRHGGAKSDAYRIGDRVPNANGILELNVTRAEITTFLGQPKPAPDTKDPNPTELLEVIVSIHNLDTRQPAAPLTLALADIRLETNGGGEEKREEEAFSFPLPPSSFPFAGVPLDVLGGKVLVEGENLRVTQHPDPENGQLAFGCAVVYRVPKQGGEGLLRVADFPPVRLQWTADEDEENEENKDSSGQ